MLSGCFGGSTKKDVVTKKIEGFHSYATEEFAIQIPDEWETLDRVDFKSDTPKNTIVSFRSNLRDPKFTPNIVIIKNELTEDVKSSDYAKALEQKLANSLTSYQQILVQEDKTVVGGQEQDTMFAHLEGRDSPTADLKRFFQKAGVKGKTAYVVMGACLSSAGDGAFKKIESAVRSFEVK